MRLGILLSYLAGAAGYLTLGHAPNLLVACAGIVLAHAGGSTAWVFSSTLLQLQTEDQVEKFHGIFKRHRQHGIL